MFNVTNLLEQANEHKMEFLHNRILREAGKTQEQYVSKLTVESLLDNEISELITLREAVENVSGKLSPLVEKALTVNTMGMKFPIKEYSDCNKKIDELFKDNNGLDETEESLAAGEIKSANEEVEEGVTNILLKKNVALVTKLHAKHHLVTKNVQNTGEWELLHPFLLEYITYAKTTNDISYIRQDFRSGITQLNKMADNFESVEKGHPNKGVNVKNIQKRIDKGQSSKKIKAHIKWMQTTYKSAIDTQAKKIKENMNEMTDISDDGIDIKDSIIKSCDIKQLLSPCTTEEPKEVILGSVTDDMVKEAAKEISTSSAFINDIIDKAIKLKSNCYGSVLDINNKIETINMNDNYTEEDVVNTEAAKMNILEHCLKSAIGVDLTAKEIKSTFVENAKLIISVANYNPRSFKESNENIMDNLNNLEWVIESSLSSSVDTRTLEEIEEGNTLDSMKASLTLSNKKFLDKYGEAAKKSNCLGIVMKDWYEPKDIDKQFKSLSDEVNKRFGKTYKNLDDLEKDYKRLRGNILGLGGEYENISKKQLGGKSVALVKDLAFEKKENHVVKKTDVTDAINCLKTVSRQLDDVNSKTTDVSLSVAYSNSKGNTVGKTKEERLEAKIDAMKRDLMKILQYNYYKTKLGQLKVLQKQSRLVIMKAARQKPTNEETNIMNKFDSCIDEIGNIIIK